MRSCPPQYPRSSTPLNPSPSLFFFSFSFVFFFLSPFLSFFSFNPPFSFRPFFFFPLLSFFPDSLCFFSFFSGFPTSAFLFLICLIFLLLHFSFFCVCACVCVSRVGGLVFFQRGSWLFLWFPMLTWASGRWLQFFSVHFQRQQPSSTLRCPSKAMLAILIMLLLESLDPQNVFTSARSRACSKY